MTFTAVSPHATIAGTLPTVLPRSTRDGTEPPPVQRDEMDIFDLVHDDLIEREAKGAAQHGGKPLRPDMCRCGHFQAVHSRNRGCIATVFSPISSSKCACRTFENQKDFLREAYEEALDLAVYLRGALAEREAGDSRRSALDAALNRMSREEIEEYAKTGKLPGWFSAAERGGRR